jgi:nicotinate-nucleotide--dimethylbenzimidazole phosphoribosyltransferase
MNDIISLDIQAEKMVGLFGYDIALPEYDNYSEDAANQYILSLGIPVGSLGIIHKLGARLAGITANPRPKIDSSIVFVFCADHGIDSNDVSCFPKHVTWANMKNMVEGSATINSFANVVGSSLAVIDIGVDGPRLDTKTLNINNTLGGEYLFSRVRNGTRDFSVCSALEFDEVCAALKSGFKIVNDLGQSYDLIVFGEMGIGNTSSASAICSALLDLAPEQVTGPGTGLSYRQLKHKVSIITKALDRNIIQNKTQLDPFMALCEYGGLEIAGIVGGMVAAATLRKPVLLDGFIIGTCALVAERMFPGISSFQIACSESAEPGHIAILNELGHDGLLHFGMRLGEGSAAALAIPIIKAAATQFHSIGSTVELIDAVPY